MNTLTDIRIQEAVVIINYFSRMEFPNTEKEIHHVEIFSIAEIRRILFRQSSFIIFFSAEKSVYNVRKDFDIEKIVKLTVKRFGIHMNVKDHFEKLRKN